MQHLYMPRKKSDPCDVPVGTSVTYDSCPDLAYNFALLAEYDYDYIISQLGHPDPNPDPDPDPVPDPDDPDSDEGDSYYRMYVKWGGEGRSICCEEGEWFGEGAWNITAVDTAFSFDWTDSKGRIWKISGGATRNLDDDDCVTPPEGVVAWNTYAITITRLD